MEQAGQAELLQFQLKHLTEWLGERRRELRHLETVLEKAKRARNTGLKPRILNEEMRMTTEKLITSHFRPAVETNPSADELRECTEIIKLLKELEEERKMKQLNISLEETKRVTNTRLYKDYHQKSVKGKVRERKHKHLPIPAMTTSSRGARGSNNPPAVTPTPSWAFPSLDAIVKQPDLGPEMENNCSTYEIREAAKNVKVLRELMIEQIRKYAQLKKSYEEEKRATNTRLHSGALEDKQLRRQHKSLSSLASRLIREGAKRLSSTPTTVTSTYPLHERAAKRSDIKPKVERNYLANEFGECIQRIKTLKDVVVKQQQNRIWMEKVLQESRAAISNKLYTNWLLQMVKGKKIQPPTLVRRRKLAITKREHMPRSFIPPGISSETVAELNHELPDSLSKVTSWLCQ